MLKNKLALCLMTYKGFKILEYIINHFNPSIIELVVAAKDNNVENDYYNEIKNLCLNNNIDFKDKHEFNNNFESNFILAISWKWLIETDKKLIVLHDSLLPKNRGFNPLVTALINGDKEIGVTAIFADEEYDAGDILFQEKIQINFPIKIQKAIELITECYLKTTKNICDTIVNNKTFKATSQNNSEATFSLWRNEEDYLINWNNSSDYIERFVNAVGFPYKGAFSYINNEKIRILDVEIYPDLIISNRDTGKIIFKHENHPVVVCEKGLIKIKKMINEKGDIFNLTPFRVRLK